MKRKAKKVKSVNSVGFSGQTGIYQVGEPLDMGPKPCHDLRYTLHLIRTYLPVLFPEPVNSTPTMLPYWL